MKLFSMKLLIRKSAQGKRIYPLSLRMIIKGFKSINLETEKDLKSMYPTCQGVQTKQVLSVGLFLRSGIRGADSASLTFCEPNSTSVSCYG